jgi:S-formylglutathione hydrolase FrmB
LDGARVDGVCNAFRWHSGSVLRPPFWARWYVASIGVAGDPAPVSLWIWVGLSGAAVALLLLGWRGARWWRRGISALTVPLCLLSAALVVNLWVGYFPTMSTAWSQLTGGLLPDETDRATVTAMQIEGTTRPRAWWFR